MATLRERGAAMRARLQKAAGGVTVVITRLSSPSPTITVTAVPSRESAETTDFGQAASQSFDFNTRNYRIEVSQLKQSGVPFLPEAGDRFTETVNGVSRIFECRRDENLTPWDWVDSTRTKVLIRCREVIS